MKVAVLSPVAWRTPPRHYGPWEQVASNIAEGLAERGIDVTLFATADSFTKGKLESVVARGYEEDAGSIPKVSECIHISHLMEQADRFDIIHNNFDYLPLTYSRLVKTPLLTTIHGFSSSKIIPVYKKYNGFCHYVSISFADRSTELDYIANIYNGIDEKDFTFNAKQGDYLLFFGRIHHEKGTYESIQIAKKARMRLVISGIIQDRQYFDEKVAPYLDDDIVYIGSSGPTKRDNLMGNAFALLHPVNFNEPFGLSVAESMFCGTPVIAFPRGSMNEIVEDGRTGYLVDTSDEAAERIADIPRIDRAYCRRRAEESFSKDKMVEEYIKVYEKLVS
jgi:glycosyltransferase involved in cell wall biosynthesis